MSKKLKAHLITAPRWFALPFFGFALLIGVVLAGGSLASLNTWLAFVCGTLLMAGGHSFNTLLDWLTGLDRPEEGSVEKDYAGGCRLIVDRILSPSEVLVNAFTWYVLALIPAIMLAIRVTPWIIAPVIFGMLITGWYSWGKFNWTHELALASGPIMSAVLGAMSAGTGVLWPPILAVVPISIIFSFAGLSLDEYPDAEQNLKRGVRSLAYKIWEFKVDLGTYLITWFIIAYVVQVLLISIGILAPLTALTFILVPLFMGECVFLKSKVPFEKVAAIIVITAAFYPLLLLVGQILGG